MRRIAFQTLGCRLNQSESAALAQQFGQAGYQVVAAAAEADVVVLNTCTVTNRADADTRKLVHRLTREAPAARIALIGCQAQLQASELAALPNVAWVVGNARKMDLPAILAEHPADGAPAVLVERPRRGSFTQPASAIDHEHTRATLKVQDGCNFFCSFCVIPYARGIPRSRDFADLWRDARELLAAGHREIVVSGVNMGLYRDGERGFAEMVDALLGLEGLARLRLSSIEPTTIPDAVVDWLAAGRPRLCRYLHIPIQSGCDAVLRRMDRRHGTTDYAEFLLDVHRRVPGIGLGTDVIVGFPGETDAEFGATLELLRELPFAYFHVFSYSARAGTKSTKSGAEVPPETIAERSRALRELSARKRRVFLEALLGQTVEVLFETRKDSHWTGLTDSYARVNVALDGPGGGDLANRLLPVRCERVHGQALVGRLA